MQSNPTMNSTDENMIYSAIDILKEKGFENIRANVSDYERPAKLVKASSSIAYQPDMTAKTLTGKCYFEIVNDTKADKDVLKEKWSLFSAMAQHKNGTFFLLVPRGKMRFTNEMLKNNEIYADVLKIS